MASTREVRWAEPAIDQLGAILDFIAADKPSAEERLRSRIANAVARLAEYPESGRRVAELERFPALYRRHRELVVPPVRVVYRLAPAAVQVLYVLRSEQRFDPDQLA